MRRIYFVSDHLGPLVEWLRSRPQGRFQVLIGNVMIQEQANITRHILALVAHDRELAEWLKTKLASGDIEIRAMPEKPGFPEGKILG